MRFLKNLGLEICLFPFDWVYGSVEVESNEGVRVIEAM